MKGWTKTKVRCRCGEKLRQKYDLNKYACNNCDLSSITLSYCGYRKQCISCLDIKSVVLFSDESCNHCRNQICSHCVEKYNLKKCFRCGPDITICKFCMTEIKHNDKKYKVCFDHTESKCNALLKDNITRCKINIPFERKYCVRHRYHHKRRIYKKK